MTLCTHLSTNELGDLLGLTYRQMDYVSRKVLKDVPGSGNHRHWDDVTIDRLTVAKALLDGIGFALVPGRSLWPQFVDAVMDADDPTPGWVTISPEGRITYHGWVAPFGECGLAARWRPIRRAAS